MLRQLFPDAVASLDELAHQHQRLEAQLETLIAGIDGIEVAARMTGADALAAVTRLAEQQVAPAASDVRDTLAEHLDTEEPVLRQLFPRTPPADIRRLRKAIIAGAPRSGPDLVLGLLEDPAQAPGYAALINDLPRPVRLLRPLLVRRYRAVKVRLGLHTLTLLCAQREERRGRGSHESRPCSPGSARVTTRRSRSWRTFGSARETSGT